MTFCEVGYLIQRLRILPLLHFSSLFSLSSLLFSQQAGRRFQILSAMRVTFYFRFWSLLVVTVTVSLTALRAVAQEKGRVNSSLSFLPDEDSYEQCLTQGVNVQRKVSSVVKAIFAECSCIYSAQMRLCTVWKPLNKTSRVKSSSDIKVFTKFVTGFRAGHVRPAITGGCEDYTSTINKLYGSDKLSYLTAQDANTSAIDWSFCHKMFLENNMGCNYTVIPANIQNCSSIQEIHCYVPSFTNTSKHMQVGKIYQLDIENGEHTVIEIPIKIDSSLPMSTENVLLLAQARTQIAVTRTSAASKSRENRSGGMCLSGNDVSYTLPMATLFLRIYLSLECSTTGRCP